MSITFSPDGKWLASCGDAETARVWDWKHETDLAWLDLQYGRVIRFSPDGTWLAGGTHEGFHTIEVDLLKEVLSETVSEE